jgi:hypothetical protein
MASENVRFSGAQALMVIAQPDIDRGDHEHGQECRGGETKDQRDCQTLEDRVGDDKGGTDHRRCGGQKNRFETDRARLQQSPTQDGALGAPAADKIDQQDRIAHNDAGKRKKTIIKVTVKDAFNSQCPSTMPIRVNGTGIRIGSGKRNEPNCATTSR